MISELIKINVDAETFFTWASKKIKFENVDIEIDGEPYDILLNLSRESRVYPYVEIVAISQDEMDYEELNLMFEDEMKPTLTNFPQKNELAFGNLIDNGNTGFELFITYLQDALLPRMDWLFDEAKFFWKVEKLIFPRDNPFKTVDEIMAAQPWESQAINLYLEGKSCKEIRKHLIDGGFNPSIKTINNQITIFRKTFGEYYIPKKNKKI